MLAAHSCRGRGALKKPYSARSAGLSEGGVLGGRHSGQKGGTCRGLKAGTFLFFFSSFFFFSQAL